VIKMSPYYDEHSLNRKMKSGFRLNIIDFNINDSIESSKKFFEKKRVAIFSISQNLDHQSTTNKLKDFESSYDRIKKLGIHEIYCCALENFANLKSKFDSINVNKIKIIPDEKGTFTKHLGMLSTISEDKTKFKSKNYMAVITDGIIEKWWDDIQSFKNNEKKLFSSEMRVENCMDYLYGSE